MPTRSAAGGAGWTDDDARNAAIGEALERYAATMAPLPPVDDPRDMRGLNVFALDDFSLHSRAQRRRRGFPYADAYVDDSLVVAYRLRDNGPVLVPRPLVTLDPARSRIATSSGLAADPSCVRALLRATQELIERDALMTTWLHSLAPPRVPVPDALVAQVERVHGEVACFDVTPAYSTHAVAAVAGTVPWRGRARAAFGIACRARWDDAVDKAWLEWAQGVSFATAAAQGPLAATRASDVTDFEAHARYYTENPKAWRRLPLWHSVASGPRPAPTPWANSVADELAHLVASLDARGVDVFYRDLTTVDTAALGIRVVRCLSPSLVPIHPDHNWPFLGGTAPDLAFRYPDAVGGRGARYPNPAPHPLG